MGFFSSCSVTKNHQYNGRGHVRDSGSLTIMPDSSSSLLLDPGGLQTQKVWTASTTPKWHPNLPPLPVNVTKLSP